MNSEQPNVNIRDFIEFYHFYNSFVQYMSRFLDSDIPHVYLGILLVLDKYGPLPISHLGEKLSIAKSNMTSLVDGMEQKGLITRSASTSDRRVVTIDVAETGAKYLDETLTCLNDILNINNPSIRREEAIEALEAMKVIMKLGAKIFYSESQ